MKFQVSKPKLSDQELIDLLVKQFPDIKEDVLDDHGLIYLQVGALARYANQCIDKARFDELSRTFSFFDKVIEKVSSNMNNAFFVSFLEHIDMDGDSEKEKSALKLLPNKYLPYYRALRNS